MNVPGILLGITMLLWSLQLLALVAISNTLLGIFALITGIVWIIVSLGVHSGTVVVNRNQA